MSEIFGLLWSVLSLGCDAATGTACWYKACGSLSFSSNKPSNEGNDSGKKAGGLGRPSGLGIIVGGRGDGAEPPSQPLPPPPDPLSPGCLKA